AALVVIGDDFSFSLSPHHPHYPITLSPITLGGMMSSNLDDGLRNAPGETTDWMRPRVLVTGANGLIGGFVMNAWRASGSQFDPVGLARQPGPNADIVADIGDLDALVAACAGIDAIVHLAATSAVESSWEAVLASNLIGTYNVFEAARRAGVPRVVFASSNHAIGTYELQAAPALYDLDDDRVYDHTAEIRPDSLYGVSKVYGEALGRHYVDQHGLSVVCLRIGGTRDPGHHSHPNQLWADMSDRRPETLALRRRMRAVWLSERDCVQLIEKSLLTQEPWVLAYGISNNPRRFWDIEHARRVLGYEPQDAAPALIGDEDAGGTG
ncbi:MAG TPA: NAD(P)-dependent oxidoreductase, partial [Thermomicrobiales bacterium]|nr:NAD(P)-dependent oxidoreductase [Thermomicrobiales bacterium]